MSLLRVIIMMTATVVLSTACTKSAEIANVPAAQVGTNEISIPTQVLASSNYPTELRNLGISDMAIDSSGQLYLASGDQIVRMSDIYASSFTSYGTQGSGVAQFDQANGIALDSSGRIYISDRGNNRIVRIDDISGTNFTAYSTVGPLQDVEIDTAGKILILDQGGAHGHITQIDDMTGTNKLVHTIPFIDYEEYPEAIAVDSQNRKYMTYDFLSSIYRIDDVLDNTYTLIDGVGNFQDIYIDRNTDMIYVGAGTWSFANKRIKEIDADNTSSFTLYGDIGNADSEVLAVGALAVNASGKIFFADRMFNFMFSYGSQKRLTRIDDIAGNGLISVKNYGTGTNGFSAPAGAAFDSQDRIYVADANGGRIIRMDDINGMNWVSYGSTGNPAAQGEFWRPSDVALDSQNRIYILDRNHCRIVRIDDMTGTNFVALGSWGSGLNQFSDPRGIAIDSQDRIYIADTDKEIVRMNDMTGAGWTSYGISGSGLSSFLPYDVAIDANDHIFVADRLHHRVVSFQDMNGTGWTTFGTQGAGTGQFDTPESIDFDPSGRIVVADYGNNRIVRFDDMAGGNYISVGTQGDGIDQFNGPLSAAVDSVGRVYASDTLNHRMIARSF